jgi:hypothetical protein
MKHNKKLDEMLLLYFLDELSEGERKIFQSHLEDCEKCRGKLHELEVMNEKLSSAPEVVPSDALLQRANQEVLNKIPVKTKKLSGFKERLRDLLDSVVMAFAHPQYQLITACLIFVLGLFVGKAWLSSDLLSDPELLLNFARRQDLTELDRDNLQKAFATYLLYSGDIEIADLIQKNGANNESGIVEVDFKVESSLPLTGGLDDPAIQDMLMYSALHDKGIERRRRAVKLLSMAEPNNKIESTLTAVMLRDKDEEIRQKAAEILVVLEGSEQLTEAFKSVVLNDPSEELRRTALEYLNNINQEGIIPVIALVASRDSSEVVRNRAVEILESLK